MVTPNLDLLDTDYVRRLRKAADEHRTATVVTAISVVAAIITYFVVRAILHRRKKTLWQRAMGYLEDLGQLRDDVVKRAKDLYEENVDSEQIAKQIGGRMKAIERELRSVDRAVRTGGREVAGRMRS